ncbi:MAG: UPF0158 family protein [Acidimicrobiales bacterium]
MEKDGLLRVRVAIHDGDGTALLAALEGRVQADVLQLAGDAVASAVGEEILGAAQLAAGWLEALRERDWPGDAELAIELEVVLGLRTVLSAKSLPVDLEELSMLLETGLGGEGGAIDLQTGEVWPAPTIEYFSEEEPDQAPDFEDPERWLYVNPEGSAEGYRDMEDFIAGVADPGRADRLGIAIEGRGAFRRFKDTISRWPEEQERWYRFSDERCRGRARQWLAMAGWRVVAAQPRAPG